MIHSKQREAMPGDLQSTVLSPLFQRAQLTVEMSSDLRRKVWAAIARSQQLLLRPARPGRHWHQETNALEETERDLMTEQGWERIPGAQLSAETTCRTKTLGPARRGAFALDTIELAFRHNVGRRQGAFKNKINAGLRAS